MKLAIKDICGDTLVVDTINDLLVVDGTVVLDLDGAEMLAEALVAFLRNVDARDN